MLFLSVILCFIGIVVITGCSGENSTVGAKDGDVVRVHYTGTLEDGTVFDTSLEREPLEFTLGGGQMIPGFEQAVIGMEVGESKTVTIPPEEAYGPRHDELIMVMGRERLPEGSDPKVGQQLQMMKEDGEIITVIIVEVSETTITIDANPPLAGKDLTFEIELVEIL
jgi:peptidylprolyl isomerase